MDKANLKKLSIVLLLFLNFLIGSFAATAQTEVAILGFHDIVNTRDPQQLPPYRREFDIDYSVDNLEKVLRYLLDKNYWFLTSQEFYDYFLTKSKPVPSEHQDQRAVMVSFDDGYKGMFNNLLPLLSKLKAEYNKPIKVVLFVNPGLMSTVDEDILYANCEQLRVGFQSGFFDVQSHGLSHRKLTELNVKELKFELSKAKFILRKCLADLDPKVASRIAYPFGASNRQVEQYASADYDSAFIYDNEFFRLGDPRNNKYRIHRLQVYKNLPPEKLIPKLEQNESLSPTKAVPSGSNRKFNSFLAPALYAIVSGAKAEGAQH